MMTGVSPEPVLDVQDLSVTIRTPAGPLHAVRGVSFDVRRGQTVCLVGESGCGKSMTSLAIMDLLPPTAPRQANRLVFDNTDLARVSHAEINALRGNRMAMIFQQPTTALNPA